MSSALVRMARRGAKGVTLTLAPGNKRRARHRGFTLLELMVVVALVALATATVMFALPDGAATRLDREAVRLSAILEGVRMQARAGALAVRWLPRGGQVGADYQFTGLPDALQPPLMWLTPGVQAAVLGGRAVVLGPEPVIGPQQIVLSLDDRQVVIATDGLGPFQVVAEPGGEP